MNDGRGIKPLTSSSFYILLALADEQRHGLGIAAEVESRTDGDIQMGTGTLYNAVKKLLEQKFIADVASSRDDDPRRRYYRIKQSGRRALEVEAKKLERVLRAAREKEVLS